MKDENNIEHGKEMGYLDHLSELRNRLLWSALVFLIFFVIGFFIEDKIRNFFLSHVDFTLNLISPEEILWIIITIAFIFALIGTLPFLCVQLWLFVRPGLTKHEQRVSLIYIPAVFFLFIGGLAFGYFIFIEMILPFVLSLNNGMFDTIFTVERYFKFIFNITIPFAMFFELPLIVMFLTSLNIVTPQFLRKTRKYAYFILVIIGTMLSPPDFIVQFVVIIPLIILYEISITMSYAVYRKKQKKHQEYMNEN